MEGVKCVPNTDLVFLLTAVENAKEDSLRLKLLAPGMTPKVVSVIGKLRRSSRPQKGDQTDPQPSSTPASSVQSTPKKDNFSISRM